MGDRVSFQFVNGDKKSVVMYDQSGGMELIHVAQLYADSMKERFAKLEDIHFPLERLEPSIAMVDFISKMFKGEEVMMHYRLYQDVEHSPYVDNGHHLINLGGI